MNVFVLSLQLSSVNVTFVQVSRGNLPPVHTKLVAPILKSPLQLEVTNHISETTFEAQSSDLKLDGMKVFDAAATLAHTVVRGLIVMFICFNF